MVSRSLGPGRISYLLMQYIPVYRYVHPLVLMSQRYALAKGNDSANILRTLLCYIAVRAKESNHVYPALWTPRIVTPRVLPGRDTYHPTMAVNHELRPRYSCGYHCRRTTGPAAATSDLPRRWLPRWPTSDVWRGHSRGYIDDHRAVHVRSSSPEDTHISCKIPVVWLMPVLIYHRNWSSRQGSKKPTGRDVLPTTTNNFRNCPPVNNHYNSKVTVPSHGMNLFCMKVKVRRKYVASNITVGA